MFIDTHDLRRNEASLTLSNIAPMDDRKFTFIAISRALQALARGLLFAQKQWFTIASLGSSSRIRAAILDLGPHFTVRLLGDRLIFQRTFAIDTSW